MESEELETVTGNELRNIYVWGKDWTLRVEVSAADDEALSKVVDQLVAFAGLWQKELNARCDNSDN